MNTISKFFLLLCTAGIAYIITKTPSTRYVAKNSKKSTGDVIITGARLHEHGQDKKYEVLITTSKSSFSVTANTLACAQIMCQITYNTQSIAQLNAQQALIDRKNKVIKMDGQVDGQFEGINLCSKNILYNFETGIIATHDQTRYTHQSGFFTVGASTVDTKNRSIEMNDGVYSEFW